MNALRQILDGLVVGVACLPAAARGQADAPPRASGRARPGVRQVDWPRARTKRARRGRGVSAPIAPPSRPRRSPRPPGAVGDRRRGGSCRSRARRTRESRASSTATSPRSSRLSVIAAPTSARRKRVPPALITADTLTLRWTIAGKGQVAAMDVVGSTPVDPDVLDCVKRDTNGWLFTAPVGGDVRLNRALVFPAPVFRRLPSLSA